jgi:hypothetical protein
MKSVYFGTANGVHNKDTENEMHTYRTDEGVEVICFHLSDEEKKQVAKTGKIWLSVHSQGRSINPILPDLMNPFANEFVECECDALELKEYAAKTEDGHMCQRCVAIMTDGNDNMKVVN